MARPPLDAREGKFRVGGGRKGASAKMSGGFPGSAVESPSLQQMYEQQLQQQHTQQQTQLQQPQQVIIPSK